MVFKIAFKDYSDGFYVRYRSSGKLYNISYITKVSMNLVCDLPYADDCYLVTQAEANMQLLMGAFGTNNQSKQDSCYVPARNCGVLSRNQHLHIWSRTGRGQDVLCT